MISRNAVLKHDAILNHDVTHKAMLYYSVRNGNPNGDPETSEPRVSPDGYSLVSDVKVKRLIRDYWSDHLGHIIYVDREIQRKMGRNGNGQGFATLADWSEHLGADTPEKAIEGCQDVRVFGSVFSKKFETTKKGKDGKDKTTTKTVSVQMLGPTQVRWGRSTEPVEIENHTITCLATREGGTKDRTMGSRSLIVAADYEQRIISSGHLGKQHKVTPEDMADQDAPS